MKPSAIAPSAVLAGCMYTKDVIGAALYVARGFSAGNPATSADFACMTSLSNNPCIIADPNTSTWDVNALSGGSNPITFDQWAQNFSIHAGPFYSVFTGNLKVPTAVDVIGYCGNCIPGSAGCKCGSPANC